MPSVQLSRGPGARLRVRRPRAGLRIATTLSSGGGLMMRSTSFATRCSARRARELMLQVAADVLRGASLSCARPLLAPTMSAPTEIPADKARNGYA